MAAPKKKFTEFIPPNKFLKKKNPFFYLNQQTTEPQCRIHNVKNTKSVGKMRV